MDIPTHGYIMKIDESRIVKTEGKPDKEYPLRITIEFRGGTETIPLHPHYMGPAPTDKLIDSNKLVPIVFDATYKQFTQKFKESSFVNGAWAATSILSIGE